MKKLAPLALLGLVAVASAQDGSVSVGPTVGAYFPTQKFVRDAFGNPVLSYGFSPVQTGRPAQNKFQPDLNIISASKNGNKLFLLPITAAFELRLIKEVTGINAGFNQQVPLIPFLRFTAGPAYYDYAITTAPGERRARKGIGFTAGAEIGISLNNRLTITAGYNWFTKSDGLDFSGVSANLTYSLVRF
ncbi:hypothetical protein EON81_19570 [bacterium]|nr:MAG: hypothetical protein EON81_19570 [bacterium]